MTTPIHDIFTVKYTEQLRRRLNDHPLASDIVFDGTSRVLLHDDPELRGEIKHSPDASFCHKDAEYPGIVLETSYLQKRKDLKRLARDYILGSGGNIRMVIGCDIEYRSSKEAAVSIWVPDEGVKNGRQYLDINDSSLVQTDAAISIPLSCLVLPGDAEGSAGIISVKYTELYGFLVFTEDQQGKKEGKENRGVKRKQPMGTVAIRERDSSPEVMGHADEMYYQKLEEADDQKADESDGT